MSHTTDKLREECGVIGVYNSDASRDAARTAYYGLFALQHRGQKSCGIAVNDDGTIIHHKDAGMLNEVFNDIILDHLSGTIAVGHVRYCPEANNNREDAQPLVMKYKKGNMTIAMNGTLVNAPQLRKKFEDSGAIFQTTNDAEIVAYVIARERISCHAIEEAVARAMDSLKGSYSLIVMSPRKLIAARDVHGVRPLCMGRTDGMYVFASESCAVDAMEATFVRDIEPGEVVCIGADGLKSDRRKCAGTGKICLFEYVYFARADSIIDGISVSESRIHAGRLLAKQYPVEADLVVPVPDSSNDAALGYSYQSGIPYGRALYRNPYIGRTFIEPTQKQRSNAVRVKFNCNKPVVKGKRIVVVDDSIVRGTTLRRIMQMLRDNGAKELHLRIASPPFLYPCYFGTDIPTQDSLVACNYTLPEITDMFYADSLGYLDIKSLPQIVDNKFSFCDACFTGNYPMDINGD